MRFLIILIALFICRSAQGQTLSDFLTPSYEIEQKAISDHGAVRYAPTSYLVEQYKLKGFELNSSVASTLIKGMEALVGSFSEAGIADVKTAFSAKGISLSSSEAQNILYHFQGGGPKVGVNAHAYVLALLSKKGGALYLAFIQEAIEEAIEEAQRPARPDSPTSISIKRVIARALKMQRLIMPKASGDWLGNAYTEVNAAYTSYDDKIADGSGKEKTLNLVVGGELTDKTSISFALGRTRNHRGGSDSLTSVSYGGDVMVHHKLNDNYGFGVFSFYQRTDIQDYDSNAEGFGGGALFSTWHEFEHFYISTANTFTKTWYEYGNDRLYVGSLWLGKNLTDSFSVALLGSFVDSVKDDQVGDNTYWILGGEASYQLNEQSRLSLGYQKTYALDDYESDTIVANFIWLF